MVAYQRRRLRASEARFSARALSTPETTYLSVGQVIIPILLSSAPVSGVMSVARLPTVGSLCKSRASARRARRCANRLPGRRSMPERQHCGSDQQSAEWPREGISSPSSSEEYVGVPLACPVSFRSDVHSLPVRRAGPPALRDGRRSEDQVGAVGGMGRLLREQADD